MGLDVVGRHRDPDRMFADDRSRSKLTPELIKIVFYYVVVSSFGIDHRKVSTYLHTTYIEM